MKKLHRISLFLILVGIAFSQEIFSQSRCNSSWSDNKFSMFIHYGLYSQLGGVWMGKPVEQGYSEQILSFGVHFSDWYEEVANDFRPEKWNPDSICNLAKDAGMRSVVMTAKHHDGFCMYNTSTTDYNVVKTSPLHRDPLMELSKACKKNGLNFGIYFSLIDWHFPAAMPISSHNADSITPAHHEYNLKQVRELLTNYGPVSELWFDMGSLTPEQSKELYHLVHSLQPECRVSGRLGNGYHDFSVMADNQLPDVPYLYPWQTAASIYPETWGYRSWQKHIPIKDKVNEKIRDLVKVVARGGNYLLNIGAKGDGSVVQYEQAVLRGVGSWLAFFGDAIYSTNHTPFAHTLPWGECTTKGKLLYLFIDPTYMGKQIQLPCTGIRHIAVYGTKGGRIPFEVTNNETVFTVPNSGEFPWIVLEADFDDLNLDHKIDHSLPLNILGGTPLFAYTCGDYYTGRTIRVGQKWLTAEMPKTIAYLDEEIDKTYNLVLNGDTVQVVLDSKKALRKKTNWKKLSFSEPLVRYPVGGTLGAIPDKFFSKAFGFEGWKKVTPETKTLPYGPLTACFVVQDIEAKCDMDLPVKIVYNNGGYIKLNGQLIYSDFQRGKKINSKIVLIPLKKGANRIIAKFYNRFGDRLKWDFEPLSSYKYFEKELPACVKSKKLNFVEILHSKDAFPIDDMDILNLRLR